MLESYQNQNTLYNNKADFVFYNSSKLVIMFCCCIFAYFCCNCKGGPDYDSSSPVIMKTLILKSLTTTGKVGPAKEDAISIQLCTSSVQFTSHSHAS